jgi:hypothetical protein
VSDSENETAITHRTVPLEIQFYGSGALDGPAGSYDGGIVDPDIGDQLGFEVWREVPDDEGQLNPVVGEGSVKAAFQVSLTGTAAGFRELARYLLAVSELDLRGHQDFHEHHEVTSVDGRTRFHIIVRRNE